ncbi:hypothetical protein HDA32_005827 [Spinactinospora alkalitolerans]|uniref:Cas3 C-terminal domain-containing protein n=1 Tax=Spinactinospora alkalitolerans TaxID=687207 RepID=A0A852U523_9ACTN|nr:hypothetical protein [Spinactinospora alkalitolerans]NYE50707.1 hypothetical protein [Spinactinospora alkalitolerans]
MNDDDDWVPTPYDDGIMVVPLWEASDGHPATHRGTPVDLSADELPAETVAELADSAVNLTHPIDLDPAELATLREVLSVPDVFDHSGWLADHHALVLHGGRRDFGGFSIVHHPQRGLEIHE